MLLRGGGGGKRMVACGGKAPFPYGHLLSQYHIDLKIICVIIFVNLYSAQINEDNGIIEGGGFCMILKQFVLSCLWYTKPVFEDAVTTA